MVDKASDSTEDHDEYVGVIPVIRAFENLARQLKKLRRLASELDGLSPEIADLIDQYSRLDAAELTVEPFADLSANVREIREHIGDTLEDKFALRSFISNSDERLLETSDAVLREIENVERELAPSLRFARRAASSRLRLRQETQPTSAVKPSETDTELVSNASGGIDPGPGQEAASSNDGGPSMAPLPVQGGKLSEVTHDDEARLRQQFGSMSENLTPQPRPNVFFEAGMAIALRPETTIFVQIGPASGFSDIAGRHLIRIDESDHQAIAALRGRLIQCDCKVSKVGHDWLRTSDFDSAVREGAEKVPTEMVQGFPESEKQSQSVAGLETPTSGTGENSPEGGWNGLVPWFRLTGIEGEFSKNDEILLVLGNYAETAATDVRLEFLDPLINSAGQDVSKQPKLNQSIAIMKPNQEVVFPIDNASDLSLRWVLGDMPGSYRVSVTCRNAATGSISTSQHKLELVSAFPFLVPDR